MSPLLRRVMEGYLGSGHPGGNFTFSVLAGKKLTEQNMAKAFTRFFNRSKWSVLRGYHVFRHSFASNLALKRVDQRVIDELTGHQTVAMR